MIEAELAKQRQIRKPISVGLNLVQQIEETGRTSEKLAQKIGNGLNGRTIDKMDAVE